MTPGTNRTSLGHSNTRVSDNTCRNEANFFCKVIVKVSCLMNLFLYGLYLHFLNYMNVNTLVKIVFDLCPYILKGSLLYWM